MWRWWALALAVAVAEAGKGHYTPTWAVHVPGGAEEADNVALDHGFINLGQIFAEHYHFEHAAVRRRSARAALPQHARLRRDARVRWARQQRVLRRSKRDLLRADDPHLNDQRWPLMWYLNRGPGLDMNVIPAWREGVTGRGVVVTILDDGLETDHPDLVANYDPLASYDVNNHDSDPQPRYDMIDSNRHGTRCAGEVAAAHNNSLCAVGVAYGASVGGVRMLDGDVTDAVEARSLSLNPQHVDVYSASWGPDDDGKTVDGPGELATRAFIEGVNKGRGGKGSIFVWASGNGGREHDNCNCDGYTNSIWTLSISSATERGDVPWYSEMCSSTLAATYSSGAVNEKQVVTTDLHHSCTSSHTGTSASAPLAAGICALALEANRDLTWRDMQHIVVRTARPERLGVRAMAAGAWRVNGVGRNVSHAFGYGLLDAAAMVRAARVWRAVPPQRRCEVSAPHADKLIPAKSQVVLTLEVRQCAGVNFLEHVQAKISLSTARRGDLQIHLTSPLGTRVTLLATRSRDISRAGFSSWPFMSVHTWGESPIGNWQLEIHNEGRYMGELSQWELVFYGTELPPQPEDEHPPPSVHNDLNGGKPIRIEESEQENSIDESKGTGLWRESQKVRDDGLKDIPEAHIVNAAGMTSAGCLTYSSTQPHQCIECSQTLYLFGGVCYEQCPGATFSSDLLPPYTIEQQSLISTRETDDPSPAVEPRLNNSETTKQEPDDAFVNRNVMLPQAPRLCLACHYTCQTCVGPSDVQCTSCPRDAVPVKNTKTVVTDKTFLCYPASVLPEILSANWYYRLNLILTLALFIIFVSLCYFYISCFLKKYGFYSKFSNNTDDWDGYKKLSLDEKHQASLEVESEIKKATDETSCSESEVDLNL